MSFFFSFPLEWGNKTGEKWNQDWVELFDDTLLLLSVCPIELLPTASLHVDSLRKYKKKWSGGSQRSGFFHSSSRHSAAHLAFPFCRRFITGRLQAVARALPTLPSTHSGLGLTGVVSGGWLEPRGGGGGGWQAITLLEALSVRQITTKCRWERSRIDGCSQRLTSVVALVSTERRPNTFWPDFNVSIFLFSKSISQILCCHKVCMVHFGPIARPKHLIVQIIQLIVWGQPVSDELHS